jgi:hypothetical protein
MYEESEAGWDELSPNKGPLSGPGSTEKNSAPFSTLVELFLKNTNFTKVIDWGCGDFNYVHQSNIPKLVDQYIGVDISEYIISYNNDSLEKRLSRHHDNKVKDKIRFLHINKELSSFALEHSNDFAGGLLIVKESMQHWQKEAMADFFQNVVPYFKVALFSEAMNCIDQYNDINLVFGYRGLDLIKIMREGGHLPYGSSINRLFHFFMHYDDEQSMNDLIRSTKDAHAVYLYEMIEGHNHKGIYDVIKYQLKEEGALEKSLIDSYGDTTFHVLYTPLCSQRNNHDLYNEEWSFYNITSNHDMHNEL